MKYFPRSRCQMKVYFLTLSSLKLLTHKSYYAMSSTVKYIVPILYLETGASSNICNGVQNGEAEHEDTKLLSQKLSIANEEKEKV